MPGPNLLGNGRQLDESLNTIISEFKLTREVEGLFRSHATQLTLQAHSGRNYEVNTYGTFTADDLTDGVAITKFQDWSDERTNWTPNEVGLSVIVPRTTLRRAADPGMLEKIGRSMANAYRSKEDRDGADILSGYVPTAGGAGNQLTASLISNVVARLSGGDKRRMGTSLPEPAPEPYFGFFHPYSMTDLASSIVPYADAPDGNALGSATVGPGRTSMSDDIIRNGWRQVAMIGGIPCYWTHNILVDSSDDAIGAVVSKESYNHLAEWEPTEETDWDQNLRAFNITITGSYTYGLYKPDVYGIEVVSDASVPS